MRLCTNFVNRPMNEEAMKAMLSASLEEKAWTSLSKIDEWEKATKGNWILSFSGGKDSTVLAYLCAKYLHSFKIQPHPLHLVFADTGLEFPEIRRFAMAFPDYLRKHFPGLEVDFQRVRPKERFDRVISKYGYPLIGKEVAEAIYAARKIRSQSVNVERERESRTSGAPESVQSCTGIVHQAQIGTENPAIPEVPAREMRGGVLSYRQAVRETAERSCKAAGAQTHGTQGGCTVQALKETAKKRVEMLGQHRNYIRAGVAASGQITREEAFNQTQMTRETKTVSSKSKQTGTTGAGGVFSNSAEQFGEKSMFNKDRWLPLCRDLPALISHLCCSKTKKEPIHRIQSRLKLYPMTATMAEESRVRKQAWARTGCNAFEGNKPMSKPMSFWTEQDVLAYIVQEGIPIAPVYGDIVAVDPDGCEYFPLMCDGCKLRTTGAERTGQIKAAR